MRHVIVVGSGIAGLIAALELSRGYEVTLVTKAKLADGNTRFAQGGIAAAMSRDDSVAKHIADTLATGAGLSQKYPVEVLCTEGPARIRDLIALGVTFDYRDGELARGLEAAHSHARVLHAGGDATGLTIETALVLAVRAAKVRVMEHAFACDLILREERVAGLEVLDAAGVVQRIDADGVVLASGGAGQVYQHTTNPLVATGDGVAIALRAGAQVADMEFYQFHPTALAMPGSTFLISEAVRGDGAVLLDAQGERFMEALHPLGDLAPRDVVARGIAMQMAKQGGRPVLLDATAMGEEFLRSRFPTIDAACRSRGLDWSRTPIPVTPAAHYWMGGVRTDVWGRTSVEGLYAVGEVACTGVHGANRLASNSLLESLVFAWRCAHLLLAEGVGERPAGDWPVWQENDASATIELAAEDGDGLEPVDRAALQALMWNAVGIRRDASGLQEAARQMSGWCSRGLGVPERETANLLSLAKVMITAALERRESRGAHYRDDYPQVSAAFQHSLIYAGKVAIRC